MAWIKRLLNPIMPVRVRGEIAEELPHHPGTRLLEHSYEANIVVWLQTMLQDLRYGARILKRNPAFSAAVLLALGIGIGANTAVFTAYKAMVLRPLDAADAGRTINLALQSDDQSASFSFSYPDYLDYRSGMHSLAGLAAFAPDRMTLTDQPPGAGQPSRHRQPQSAFFLRTHRLGRGGQRLHGFRQLFCGVG